VIRKARSRFGMAAPATAVLWNRSDPIIQPRKAAPHNGAPLTWAGTPDVAGLGGGTGRMIFIDAFHDVRRGRLLGLKTGVSLAALVTVGMSGQAWAQAEITPLSPDTSQQAVQGQEQGEEQTDPAGNDIVVTGRRAALEAADERKRRSETIIDSVVADDAGKLPDNSITEVLQRVSGVTIVRFAALNDPDHYSVEGSGIQVRGLTGVASRLNGRDIFSANGGRAIQFADVTPELMAAVDVYKASTADLIEGGTGGQIDLRTKVPFDFNDGFHVAGTGEGSMGDLTRKVDASGSILASASFQTGIGHVGILADYARSRLSSTSNFFRAQPFFRTNISGTDYFIPGGYEYGEEKFQRTRTGLYGAVQWSPADSLTFTGTFFQSRYRNRSGDWGSFVTQVPGDNGLVVDPAVSEFDENNLFISSPSLTSRSNGTFLPNATLTSGGNKGAYRSETTTRDYSLSAAWAPADGPISVRGAIQRVTSSQDYGRLDVFRDVNFQSGFGLDLSGDLPSASLPAGSQDYLNDPANYFWSASMPHDERNRGRLDSAQLDLEYKFADSFFRSVKVGGRIAKRRERDQQNGYNWVALGRGWNGDPQLTFANAAPGDVEQHIFKDFFHGQTTLPANLFFPTDELVRRNIGDRTELTRSPPAGFCPATIDNDNNPATPPVDNPLYFNCSAYGPLGQTGYGGLATNPDLVPNSNDTKTYAGYALVRFGSSEGRGLSGNVGARVVRIENNAIGFILQNSNTFIRNGQLLTLNTTTTPRDGRANFTRVLPSINFEYAPTRNTKVRAGYNITLDLPGFDALRASGSIGVATTAAATAGQPGNFVNFTTDAGNPLLRPTRSDNFDISLEWYPRPGTTFHLSPFYKRLTDTLVYTLAQQPITVVFSDGTTETTTGNATGIANADGAAKIKGFEVGGRFFFDMLPGLLSGIGFEGNYTFIDSRNPGNLYRDIFGVPASDLPLVGLSKHNFNATLLYERGVVSARAAYSWRTRYLQSTTANGLTPTYRYYTAPGTFTDTVISLPQYGDTYGQLEAGVRFRITENFSYSIQGTNLLNSTTRTVQGGYPGGKLVGRNWFQTDRRLSVGISLAF